jgi:nucleotide-binding universal stress UspA family protein
MFPPKTILVPTDLSPNAERALDYAVGLASRLDAKIHLLNVVGVQALGVEYGVVVTQSVVQDILDGNQAALDKLVKARAGKAAFARTELEVGDARTVIEATARRIGADLIVMGTHGRRGVRRLLVGSVAESVVRESPCPVLLVREPVS